MRNQAHKTILQRKLSDGARSNAAPSKRASQWAQAIVSAATECVGLTLAMGRRHVLRSKSDDLPAIIADCAMIVWTENEHGQSAFVCLDAAFLSALIEIQTIGRIVGRASEKRTPSQTDFALVAPFVETVLTRAAEDELAQAKLRPRRLVAHPSALLQALGHCETSVCVLSFRLGETEVSGKIIIGSARNEAKSAVSQPHETLAQMCPELESLTAEMTVIVHEFSTTLAHSHKLKVDDRLTLPADVLGNAALSAGPKGPKFSVELGKLGARRAVRLRRDVVGLTYEDPLTDLNPLINSVASAEDLTDLDGELEELLDEDWLAVLDEHEKTAPLVEKGGSI